MELMTSCIIEDSLKPYDICDIINTDKAHIVKKYTGQKLFGVLYPYDKEGVGLLILDGVCDVKVDKDTKMGDDLAEYAHKQIKNKYKKKVFIKRLIALENGISGDIVKAKFIY